MDIVTRISKGQGLAASRIANNGGIWHVYKVEDLLTGETQVFRRLHIKDIDGNVGDGRELFEHRVAVEKDMKQHLPRWILDYHVVLHSAAWRDPKMDMAYMTEPFLEDAFEFTDERYIELARSTPHEAERLLKQVVYLFSVLFEHGIVHGDAHPGNVLIVPNKRPVPRRLGQYRVVLIDLDWAHSARVPFSDNQLKSLRDICSDDTPKTFEDRPCEKHDSDGDFFCSYRATALATSGDPSGTPLPYVDLSVFAYNLYDEFLCTSLADVAPKRLMDYIENMYTVSHAVDFDVTRLTRST